MDNHKVGRFFETQCSSYSDNLQNTERESSQQSARFSRPCDTSETATRADKRANSLCQ